MTNNELLITFRTFINENENQFDIACALKDKQLIKEYKTTPYYHATGNTIEQAYDYFLRTGGKVDSIIQAIVNIDNETLNNALSVLTSHFSLDNLTENVDTDLFKELLPYIKK